jgi:hypothetical protein
MQEGQIIAIQGARVSTYGGRSLNIGNDHAKVEFDPTDLEKFHVLKKWYAQ